MKGGWVERGMVRLMDGEGVRQRDCEVGLAGLLVCRPQSLLSTNWFPPLLLHPHSFPCFGQMTSACWWSLPAGQP